MVGRQRCEAMHFEVRLIVFAFRSSAQSKALGKIHISQRKEIAKKSLILQHCERSEQRTQRNQTFRQVKLVVTIVKLVTKVKLLSKVTLVTSVTKVTLVNLIVKLTTSLVTRI